MADALKTFATEAGEGIGDRISDTLRRDLGGPLSNLVQAVYAEIRTASQRANQAARQDAGGRVIDAQHRAAPDPEPQASAAGGAPPKLPTTATDAAAGAGADGTAADAAAGAAEAGAALEGLAAVAGPAALVIAGLAVSAVAVKKAFDVLTHYADERAASLRRFSSVIAAAEARQRAADIAQQQRQAQRLGPDLANFQSARASAGREIQRLKDAILQPLIKILTPIAEAAGAVLGLLADITEAITAGADATKDGLATVALALSPLALIWRFLQWLRSWLPQRQKKAPPGLLDMFLQMG